MTGEAAPELDKQEDRRGIALTRQQQVADDRRQPSRTRQWTAGSGGSGSGGRRGSRRRRRTTGMRGSCSRGGGSRGAAPPCRARTCTARHRATRCAPTCCMHSSVFRAPCPLHLPVIFLFAPCVPVIAIPSDEVCQT